MEISDEVTTAPQALELSQNLGDIHVQKLINSGNLILNLKSVLGKFKVASAGSFYFGQVQ